MQSLSQVEIIQHCIQICFVKRSPDTSEEEEGKTEEEECEGRDVCGGILCRAERYADLGFAPDRLYVLCFCLQVHDGGEIDEERKPGLPSRWLLYLSQYTYRVIARSIRAYLKCLNFTAFKIKSNHLQTNYAVVISILSLSILSSLETAC